MARGTGRRRFRMRAGARRLLDRIWPDLPTTWADVPRRLRPALVQIVRLTAAATIAYVVADLVSPGILDLTAPLTALLVVQASTVGTLLMGLVRVGAVLTGVVVAVVVTTWIGLSWWSLAGVIAVTLVLAGVLRLGDQTLETPISAMLILAVAAPDLAGEVRIVNTLIGTGVGVLFAFLVPVAIPNTRAGEAVRQVARSQASLLAEVATALGSGPPAREEAAAWLEWSDHVVADAASAGEAVRTVERTRRLNPRALLVVLSREAVVPERVDDAPARELRRAFAVVLDDVAAGVRAFGELVRSEYGRRAPDRRGSRERGLDAVGEARAVLTELTLLDLDPRERSDLWVLHGSVLASVEHVLEQLDPEREQPVHALRPDATRAIPVVRPTEPTA